MIYCLGPTIGISRYINHLLQPIHVQVANAKNFFKESNAIYMLKNYTKQGHLRPNTLFTTLHVDNSRTVLPHEQSVKALHRFLNEYIPNR